MAKRNNKTNTDLHNTTQKTNDWATTQTPLKPVWTRVFRKVKQFLVQFWHPLCFSFCKPTISHEWGKGQRAITSNETYPWSFVTQIFRNG